MSFIHIVFCWIEVVILIHEVVNPDQYTDQYGHNTIEYCYTCTMS